MLPSNSISLRTRLKKNAVNIDHFHPKVSLYWKYNKKSNIIRNSYVAQWKQ